MTDGTARRAAQAAIAGFVLLGAALSGQPSAVVAVAAVCGLGLIAVLPGGGRLLLAGALAVAAAVTVLGHGGSANVGWFAFCLLGAWCAVHGGARTAAGFFAVVTLVLGTEAGLAAEPDPGWLAWFTGTAFSVVVCVMARRQYELLDQLRAAQAGLADRVRAEERARVARELHDVIAHAMTVSLLHVSSARLALEEEPAEAAAALERAEELGRQSLTEVRHAVGLLRDGPGGTVPLPGAGELPALVEGFRSAGAQVAYTVVGDPGGLPATTGLTVYRILQESLTNAVRHGSGDPATVRLEVGPASTVLTVDSAGPASARAGQGVGLLSMRERAEALGGRLDAGPAGTGWRVRAVLPA